MMLQAHSLGSFLAALLNQLDENSAQDEKSKHTSFIEESPTFNKEMETAMAETLAHKSPHDKSGRLEV